MHVDPLNRRFLSGMSLASRLSFYGILGMLGGATICPLLCFMRCLLRVFASCVRKGGSRGGSH